MFLCQQGSLDFLELDLLCDGREDCGEEASVCLASRQTPKLIVSPLSIRGVNFMLYCLPGLKDMERLTDPCTNQGTFISPDHPLLGLEKIPRFKIPDVTVNCKNVFGELYVYLSCLGRCINSSCVLSPLSYNSCPKEFPDKSFALAKDGYLTFVVKFRDKFHNRFFLCKNSKCLNFDKVCNLVNDCGDSSDEANCTNHFQCNTSKSYIPYTMKCDGKINCVDYSDECNHECGKEIIPGKFLKDFTWFIGGSAVLMNLASLWNVLRNPCQKRNSALINLTFKVLINVGDLITGLYLLLISIIDSLYFGENYCQNQLTWLSSDTCAFLGILNSIGATLSLFSMTYLSVFRVVSIKTHAIDMIERIKSILVGIVAVIVLSSVTIACTPLLSTFEDFYVNGMVYSKNISLFIGAADKNNYLDVIDAYFGKISRREMSWKDMQGLINLMFTNDYGETYRRKVHFYGNEGVCLFKYFVKSNDPQRIFVWMMLTVNFMCFVVISMCYSLIITGAKRTRRRVIKMMPKINAKRRDRDTARLQRNITRIIISDLVCWLPFLLICVLHSFEVIDATFLYTISSVVILPINSFINPFLYDDFIIKRLLDTKRLASIGLKLTIAEFFTKSPTKDTDSGANLQGDIKAAKNVNMIQEITAHSQEPKITTGSLLQSCDQVSTFKSSCKHLYFVFEMSQPNFNSR